MWFDDSGKHPLGRGSQRMPLPDGRIGHHPRSIARIAALHVSADFAQTSSPVGSSKT
jgi:hypothetical protein